MNTPRQWLTVFGIAMVSAGLALIYLPLGLMFAGFVVLLEVLTAKEKV